MDSPCPSIQLKRRTFALRPLNFVDNTSLELAVYAWSCESISRGKGDSPPSTVSGHLVRYQTWLKIYATEDPALVFLYILLRTKSNFLNWKYFFSVMLLTVRVHLFFLLNCSTFISLSPLQCFLCFSYVAFYLWCPVVP